MSSADFYDDFVTSQIVSGINDRIYGLYKRLCAYRLDADTSVLEVGCGIGTLTFLLLKKVKPERIEAIDISPRSIEFAIKQLNQPDLLLTASDVLQYQPKASEFDRIIFFDVLEHIPLEQHARIFERVASWMHDESLLMINLPNPRYILYDQQHNPKVLQETDQPVFLAALTAALEKSSLDIVQLETYSVWVKEDYQFLVVRKRKDFTEELLSDKRNILEKGITWWKRKWRKLRFPYPPQLKAN